MRSASSSSGVPASSSRCLAAFLPMPATSFSSAGRSSLLLDVTQGLVEDQVPRVVGGVGRDEDRRAGPELVAIGLVEEPQASRDDDEALLRQPLAGCRRELVIDERTDTDIRERRGSLGTRVGHGIVEQRDLLVVAEGGTTGRAARPPPR